jgi:alkylation response protein AidB-like acyl-CoA dehydrogenase
MDLTDSREDAAFRSEVSAWLNAHLTDELRTLGADLSTDSELRLAWERELGRGGWIGIDWPAEFGGRGATVTQSLVWHEEYARACAPVRAFFGEGLLGPTLMAMGTEEQKRRFLPPILRGDEQWCQGFSEPGAGSDLAAVRTKAWRDGDEWVLEGQKAWTSQAQTADWIFVLARTDSAVPKHKEMSFLLVPVDQPGVEIRPIRQLTGTCEFNEVFFDGARTAADLIVGNPGDGWKAAMATLSFERGTAFLGQQVRFAQEFWALVQQTRELGEANNPLVRQQLADAYIGLHIMRCTGYRTVTEVGRTGRPGPESSIGKLFWSQWHQRLGELEMDLLGLPGQVVPKDGLSRWQQSFLFGRAHTIYAGSSEIQRSIVAERVLGLPREPTS